MSAFLRAQIVNQDAYVFELGDLGVATFAVLHTLVEVPAFVSG